ncbi:DUF6214 family protein [Streptomyces sp. NPDC088725]|uniref:DUF6214 family protein n=1 Tax=Streptomyces sp. NPDC088725 TaxID=3365873 RepID=UPI00380084FF
MSEHKLISAQSPDETLAPAPPRWEVQGYGTVTGAGEEQDGVTRCEVRPPWLDVRLTFADGARLDVLAVVREGRIAIEDAQADPPLALDGLAALAEVIREALEDACQAFIGPPRGLETERGEPVIPVALAEPVVPVVPFVPTELLDLPEPAETHLAGPAKPAESAPEPTLADAPVLCEAASADEATGFGTPGGGEARTGGGAELPGRHRARPSAPRGSAGRRGAADVYRTAQREGGDPVLAVMAATGLSRRRALRLIAGARDEGLLTPRHQRR